MAFNSGVFKSHRFLWRLVFLLFVGPASADIQLPQNADVCVSWAAGDLKAALRSVGIELASADVVVICPQASLGEQSFSIDITKGRATIRAGDSVGAMYGLQELAEQIVVAGKSSTWDQLAGRLYNTTQHPCLEVRAENAFIHLHPFMLNDLEMWRSYIDMLARNRFNLLD